MRVITDSMDLEYNRLFMRWGVGALLEQLTNDYKVFPHFGSPHLTFYFEELE